MKVKVLNVNGKTYHITTNNGKIEKMVLFEDDEEKSIPNEELKSIMITLQNDIKNSKTILNITENIKNLIKNNNIKNYKEYNEYLKSLNLNNKDNEKINEDLKEFLRLNLQKEYEYNYLIENQLAHLNESRSENERLITTIEKDRSIVRYTLAIYDVKTGETKPIDDRKLDFNIETEELFIKGISQNIQKNCVKKESTFSTYPDGASTLANYCYQSTNYAIFNLNGFNNIYAENIKKQTEETYYKEINDNIGQLKKQEETEEIKEPINQIEENNEMVVENRVEEKQGKARVRQKVKTIHGNIQGNISKNYYYILAIIAIIIIYIVYVIINLS